MGDQNLDADSDPESRPRSAFSVILICAKECAAKPLAGLMAEVSLAIVQPSSYAPSSGQTRGDSRSAVNAGWTCFYKTLAVILLVLMVVLPWFARITGAGFLARRLKNLSYF